MLLIALVVQETRKVVEARDGQLGLGLRQSSGALEMGMKGKVSDGPLTRLKHGWVVTTIGYSNSNPGCLFCPCPLPQPG